MIGPQTRAWTWGPAMLALGFAVTAALPSLWKKTRLAGDFGLMALGLLVTGWFAWRAWLSPVAELGEADLMLLCGVVGTFVCVRAIEGNAQAERILSWGIALLLLANILVVWKQVLDPSFSPIFRSRAAGAPSGFYAHYNEGANYLIASSLMVAADALFRKHSLLPRIFLGLVSIGGLAAVYFTHSRGGILGAALGAGVFTGLLLMVGQRDKARWFAPAVIAIPLAGLILGGFVYAGWMSSQQLRMAGSGITQMMDNNGRLHLLGIALSCVGLHPMAGGGSRSFSWESFRFAESRLQGDVITHLPEQVHNELMQAATDYGIIGAGLLVGLLATLVLVGVIRTLFSESRKEPDFDDVWRIGGLSALVGMFIQSCFSFVFHLLPGAILLGICLGQIARTTPRPGKVPQVMGSKILLSAVAIACVVFLLPVGWNGSRVTGVLWSSYFSKQPVTSSESRIDSLGEALDIRPQSSLYQERAFVFQETSSMIEGDPSKQMAGRAIADYEEAELLHPFDPNPVINRANVLSQQHRDREAEDAYNRAISLQGGMEPSFRARFSLAKHLMNKGLRQFNAEYPADSLAALEIAAQQMEESIKQMHWVIPDMRSPRVSVQESLGTAREANGDYEGAMKAYDFATTLYEGTRAHYRAGLLNGKMAASAWSARHPAEAMGYFIEAKRRIEQATQLPQGITPSQRIEYLSYLDEAIGYLKGAKIEPVAPWR
ncbi:MAG: O-antigen ligase family protein [Verrucomicrobiota bacterium]